MLVILFVFHFLLPTFAYLRLQSANTNPHVLPKAFSQEPRSPLSFTPPASIFWWASFQYDAPGTFEINLCGGNEIIATFCSGTNTKCFGDTVLSVSGDSISYSNNDYCGLCSQLSFTIPEGCNDYSFTISCYDGGEQCGGIVNLGIYPAINKISSSNCLYPGERLQPGSCLQSQDANHFFCYTAGGSVCVASLSTSQNQFECSWLAYSNFENTPGNLTFSNGTLIAEDSSGNQYWSAVGAQNDPMTFLQMQVDGNVVIWTGNGRDRQSVLWACNGYANPCSLCCCCSEPWWDTCTNELGSPSRSPVNSPTFPPSVHPTLLPTADTSDGWFDCSSTFCYVVSNGIRTNVNITANCTNVFPGGGLNTFLIPFNPQSVLNLYYFSTDDVISFLRFPSPPAYNDIIQQTFLTETKKNLKLILPHNQTIVLRSCNVDSLSESDFYNLYQPALTPTPTPTQQPTTSLASLTTFPKRGKSSLAALSSLVPVVVSLITYFITAYQLASKAKDLYNKELLVRLLVDEKLTFNENVLAVLHHHNYYFLLFPSFLTPGIGRYINEQNLINLVHEIHQLKNAGGQVDDIKILIRKDYKQYFTLNEQIINFETDLKAYLGGSPDTSSQKNAITSNGYEKAAITDKYDEEPSPIAEPQDIIFEGGEIAL